MKTITIVISESEKNSATIDISASDELGEVLTKIANGEDTEGLITPENAGVLQVFANITEAMHKGFKGMTKPVITVVS